MQKKPYYILSATPTELSLLKNLFNSGTGTLNDLLRNPPNIRYGGWDLNTLVSPEIIKGEYLELNGAERKLLRLYEDGTFVSRFHADGDFLCWSSYPKINQVALIEITYNFVDLYRRFIPHFNIKPNQIRFNINLLNTKIDSDSSLYLTPHQIGSGAWVFNNSKKNAPGDLIDKEIVMDTNEVINSYPKVAFKIIEVFYNWFGFEIKDIPYANQDEENNKYIDIAQLKKIK